MVPIRNYIYSLEQQASNAITTNVSAQNMTDGNMTAGNMTMSAGDNMTSMANNLTMEMDDKYSAGG